MVLENISCVKYPTSYESQLQLVSVLVDHLVCLQCLFHYAVGLTATRKSVVFEQVLRAIWL